MSSFVLGTLQLPSPLPLQLAQHLAATLLGTPAIQQSLQLQLPAEAASLDVAPLLALSLINASAVDHSKTQIALRDLIPGLTRSSFPGDFAFIGALSQKTTTFGNPHTFRYPVMSYASSIASEWASQAGSRLALAWPGWSECLVNVFARLDSESEEQAAFGVPLVMAVLQGAPELVRDNALLANAFVSSAGVDDLLAEFPEVYDLVQDADSSSIGQHGEDVHPPSASAASRQEEPAKVDFAAEVGWKLYSHAEVASALKASVDVGRPNTPGMPYTGEKPSPRVALLEKMKASSAVREIVQQPRDLGFIADMHGRFPHFKDVIDYLQRHFALYASGDEGAPVHFPPMLLRGSAGIGKTFFGQTLAEHLKVRFEERDLSIMSDSMVISGMASTWKDSAPGLVFETLMNHGQANPLILLNEVDKCTVIGREHRSPMSAMYALLEKRSAKAWSDEFAGVPIDTTRVNWILTANDGTIPEPILSRVKVFDVRNPTRDEQRAIVRYIWSDLVTRDFPRGCGFSTQLPDDVCEFGTSLSSRELGKLLTDSAGAAVLANRRELMVEDLRKVQHGRSASGGPQKIGF